MVGLRSTASSGKCGCLFPDRKEIVESWFKLNFFSKAV